MTQRKRKKAIPVMLLWSKQEQRRFVDTVERLTAVAGDMAMLLHEPVERAKAAAATRAARAAAGVGAVSNGQEGMTAVQMSWSLVGTDLEWTFGAVWRLLAEGGNCDAVGGAEYHRVLDEWRVAGFPPIVPFIRERANIGPNG